MQPRFPAQRPTRHLACMLAMAFLLLAAPSQAAPDAMLESIHAFLHEQVMASGDVAASGDEVVIEIHPPRARLSSCEQPDPFLPHASSTRLMGRVSVGVRCGDQGRQVRYLQADIHIMGSYVVMAQDVDVGQTIRPEHLAEQQGSLDRLPQHTVLDPGQAVGQQASRPLAAGTTLQDHHLRPRQLVKRGQRVLIEVRGQGFRISRQAEALESGGQGDNIRVRLPDRRLLEARVIDEGRLTVDF
ncbi:MULTISPECIES: flagellar basal body P-ring formation chaperone FlgA [Halomonas]|uniref:Flagella basal body P-ring formation protein FlgA n=1 Tax=Halomonas ventosae TaxID=229007 RepID=A0A4V3C247_9GAMM|nr:flagellar basal body P-ring formation chaperone FlgA [Halomonas ventosae]TDO16769.1 flagella basal body P-ring formation protein FlgA [Halomonas ventosae]